MGAQSDRADAVYAALLERAGERWVQPRKERVERLLDYLGDPQKTYRIIHITGTNGKTSTARITDSLLRAHDLRTGLFTSPHLERFTERIQIDGEPISDRAVADAWDEMSPFVALVDAELAEIGEEPLTFFELMVALAFVAFAEAPIDVLVLEVGMGGTWDATNTADGDVAVFTPIGLDHTDRLGDTEAEIAEVKAGIIKPGAGVVSAAQTPEVEAVLREAAAANDATIAFEGEDFTVSEHRLAVGGQLVTITGVAGTYTDEYLPLYGAHQGKNAALAVAAVETLIGGGTQAITGEVLAQGLQEATSPGRLQLIGIAPTVVVDAAHNPHGAASVVAALKESFDFDEWGLVLGVLGDKDAAGIVDLLGPEVAHIFTTQPDSPRALDSDSLADIVENAGYRATVTYSLPEAADAAREWAVSAPQAAGGRRAVLITGSVLLAGEAITLAKAENWKAGFEQ